MSTLSINQKLVSAVFYETNEEILVLLKQGGDLSLVSAMAHTLELEDILENVEKYRGGSNLSFWGDLPQSLDAQWVAPLWGDQLKAIQILAKQGADLDLGIRLAKLFAAEESLTWLKKEKVRQVIQKERKLLSEASPGLRSSKRPTKRI